MEQALVNRVEKLEAKQTVAERKLFRVINDEAEVDRLEALRSGCFDHPSGDRETAGPGAIVRRLSLGEKHVDWLEKGPRLLADAYGWAGYCLMIVALAASSVRQPHS